MRKRIMVTSALLLLVTLGLTADALPSPQDSRGIGSGIRITQINGVSVQAGRVVPAGNVTVLPNTLYHDDGYPDDVLEERILEAGLNSVEALRGWALCEAELHAEAVIDRGSADSVYAYPHNAPLNSADKDGNVTEDDAARARELRANAVRYDRAASLAKAAELPCTNTARAPNEGNYVRLTGVGTDGKNRTVDIPDYRLVELPVEYFIFEGECAADLIANAKEIAATPVDAKPGMRGGLDTFTERDKARALVRQKAQAAMLAAARVPC